MGTIKKISKYRPSILQGTLDFSSAKKSFSLTAEHPYESAAIRFLILTLCVLAFAYLYFVAASIMNIVARKEASVQTTRLQSSLALMEKEYFALSHAVDESVADRMGLVTVEDTHYVYEPSTAVAATIRGNGI